VNLDASVIGTIFAVVVPVCAFAGWINRLMIKSALFDYDKDLRKRLHDRLDGISEVIHENTLEIERLKERLRKNGA
jgi:hypothetical protein